MRKQFAVLGLGSFGRSVALTLENMGCDVLVVDESYEKVQEISDKVSYAVKADVSEPDALQALDHRLALVILEGNFQFRLGVAIDAIVGDVAFVLEQLGDSHFQLGRRHGYRHFVCALTVTNTGKQVSDRILHAHSVSPITS